MLLPDEDLEWVSAVGVAWGAAAPGKDVVSAGRDGPASAAMKQHMRFPARIGTPTPTSKNKPLPVRPVAFKRNWT